MEPWNPMKPFAVAVALTLALVAPAWATHQSQATGGFSAEQSRDVEEIVREYILNLPEIVAEAIRKLQVQEEQADEQSRREAAKGVKPVNDDDHTMGSADAAVKIRPTETEMASRATRGGNYCLDWRLLSFSKAATRPSRSTIGAGHTVG